MNGSYGLKSSDIRAGKPIPSFASFGLRTHFPDISGSLESPDALGASPTESKWSNASCSRAAEPPLRHRGCQREPRDASRGAYISVPAYLKAPARGEGGDEIFYIVDRCGDPQNVVNPAFDRSALPFYLRSGSAAVIGLGSSYKIDNGASDGIYTSVLRADVSSDGGNRLLTSGLSKPDLPEEYIQSTTYYDRQGIAKCRPTIYSSMTRDARNISATTDCLHNPSPDGIVSISESLWRPDNITDNRAGDIGDVNAHRAPMSNIAISKVDRMVDADPRDDVICQEASERQRALLKDFLSAAELQSDRRLKLDIYKRALNMVKESEHREIILLEMMETVAQHLDTDASIKEWKKVLQDNPEHSRLWVMYLDHRQASFAAFNYEDILQVYKDCLKDLHFVSTQSSRASGGRDKLYEIRTLLLLRVTLLMRGSGYLEHAFALWQALLEIDFFCPQSLQHPGDESSSSFSHHKAAAFESFWESEKPRLGESGAKGWDESCITDCRSSSANVASKYPFASEETADSPWILKERRCLLESRKPANSTHDAVGLDPHKVVLYSDVQPFLTFSTFSNNRHVLLEAFLAFCQLPSYKADSLTKMWSRQGLVCSNDVFLDAKILDANFSSNGSKGGGLNTKDRSECASKGLPFDSWVSNFQVDTMTLFADSTSWFSAFALWQKVYDDECCGLTEKSVILRALRSLAASDLHSDEFSEYVVALEASVCPRRAHATVKHILSKRPSSLRLYNAYAIVEYRLGHFQKAENALTISMNMESSLHSESRRENILIWRTWIWELLRAGGSQAALLRLLCYGDSNVETMRAVPPEQDPDVNTSILRVKIRLLAYRDEMLRAQSLRHVVLAMECLMLLAYIIDDTTIIKAAEIFSDNLRILQRDCATDDCIHELLHQAFAHLLHHHESRDPLKSPEMRSLFANSISAFPSNMIFRSLQAWIDGRYGNIDRIRSNVDQCAILNGPVHKLTDDLCLHVSNIYIELTGIYGSNINSVRSTFKYAVESKNGAHCATLWKTYYLFECSNRATTNAKAILYMGIRACPWAKELYLLPFEYPLTGPDGMSEADLHGLYNLMIEKELRVHVVMDTLT